MDLYLLLCSFLNSADFTVILGESCTLLHDADLVLSNVSQTAALTTNPAATAASPSELSPELLAQVGATALAASPAAQLTNSPAADGLQAVSCTC